MNFSKMEYLYAKFFIFLCKKRRIAADSCRRMAVYCDSVHCSTAELNVHNFP